MAGKGKPRRKPAAKPAKGHKLPEPIEEGFVLTDTVKKNWVIGAKLGSGGFGTVYFASEAGKKENDYVIKVEYHDNGPLFTELHCYNNIGKPNQITEWNKKKKLPYLGLSPYYGFGSFEYGNSKYRFMVIERFGKDLQKLLDENQKKFPVHTVYLISLSMINVLEYIHTSGYIHGDIKAANLLLGRKKGTENQVYLVDMGLACKYMKDNVHKKEMPDPKKAHNGTPEFASRDAHKGCFSRRSDFEILCFNMLQWLCGELPWEKFISDNKKLQSEKEKYMADVDNFLQILFPDEHCPGGMKKLLSYVSSLKFEDEPDYNYCSKIIKEDLKKIGCDKEALAFKSSPKKKSSAAVKPAKETASNKENARATRSTGQEKRKTVSESVLPSGVIPTPAMLEVMNKRAEPKPPKTRRKK